MTGWLSIPNNIGTQDYVFRIPLEPAIAANPSETSLDAIGIAVNGVVLSNEYAGHNASGWIPLNNEIATFDARHGHPAQFHYHFEPVYLTRNNPAALTGLMPGGFPIYGPEEANGSQPAGLDDCNGHTHAKTEYPEGIYHDHATEQEPYLCGY